MSIRGGIRRGCVPKVNKSRRTPRAAELGFAVFFRHLEIMLDRPDLKIELPDFIARLGDKTQRAEIVAAIDARPPHPPNETGPPPKAPRHRTPR